MSGTSPDGLAAIAAGGGAPAWGALASETRCGRRRPVTQAQAYRYTGAERAQRPLSPTARAATRPAWPWSRRTGAEGPQGPMAYAFARHRVPLSQDGLPERPGWLGRKRPRGPEPTAADALSNAPARSPLRPWVWLRGLRWAVAPCWEAGNTARGRAHSAGRTYAGWHHPMLRTRRAPFFLWPWQGRLGEKSASTHGVAAAPALPSRVAPAYRDACREPRGCGVGATAPSPGLSRASSTPRNGGLKKVAL